MNVALCRNCGLIFSPREVCYGCSKAPKQPMTVDRLGALLREVERAKLPAPPTGGARSG